MDFPYFLDADDIVQYLDLTRHNFVADVYGNDCHKLESEPVCTEE